MARIRSKDTAPEKAVRSLLHRMGYRFRLHRRTLPGTPDVVLPRYRTVIFVHGCFWHQHEGCRLASRPSSNTAYWTDKLRRNRERDAEHTAAVESAGWKVAIIWECQTKDLKQLEEILSRLLDPRVHPETD